MKSVAHETVRLKTQSQDWWEEATVINGFFLTVLGIKEYSSKPERAAK